MIGAALRSVAQKGAELAKQLAEEATTGIGHLSATSLPIGPYAGFKFHKDYKLGAQTGTAGTHGIWRIFSGTARSPSAVVKDVSIWVIDKRELAGKGDDVTLSGSAHGAAAVWQQRWEGVLQQQRRGCALMTRLKHPGVVRVVLPLEETATHMVLVTEAVVGCLRELGAPASGGGMGGGSTEPGTAAPGPGAPSLSQLEVKLGLLQLVEVLGFLQGTARVAHCGLSPQAIMVTPDGAWKVAGFAFAVPLAGPASGAGAGAGTGAGPGPDGGAAPPYQFNDPFPPLWEELSKPQLPYTAPELVVPPGGAAFASPYLPSSPHAPSWAAADSFSLGALVYELVLTSASSAGAPSAAAGAAAGAPPQLLPVRCSVQQYGSRLAALGAAVAAAAAGAGDGATVGAAAGVDMSRIPPELRGPLLALVAPAPASRAEPASLARCAWFEGDQLLRALRFLEGMVQSEPRHKLAFLADLADEGATGSANGLVGSAGGGGGAGGVAGGAASEAPGRALWRRMSDRLLVGCVLPPLLQEVRNGGPVGVAALPVALAVCRRLGRAAFAERALPQLTPVIEAAGAPGHGTGSGGGGGGGAMLAALVGQAEALAALMDGPTIDRLLLPMLLRALLGPVHAAPAGGGAHAPGEPHAAPAAADPRLAQAALGKLHSLVAAGLLDGRAHQVRAQLLPGLRASAARTTSAAVRVACLGLMAALASKVDRTEGEAMAGTCAQLLSVDTSGATLAAVAALCEALAAAPGWGPAAAAGRLLPLLSPRLLAPGLSPQQLGALSGAMQRMLALVVRHAEDATQLRVSGGGAPMAETSSAALLGAPTAAAGPGSGAGGSTSAIGRAQGTTTKSSSSMAVTTWAPSIGSASTPAAASAAPNGSVASTPAAPTSAAANGPAAVNGQHMQTIDRSSTWATSLRSPAPASGATGSGSGSGGGGGLQAWATAGSSHEPRASTSYLQQTTWEPAASANTRSSGAGGSGTASTVDWQFAMPHGWGQPGGPAVGNQGSAQRVTHGSATHGPGHEGHGVVGQGAVGWGLSGSAASSTGLGGTGGNAAAASSGLRAGPADPFATLAPIVPVLSSASATLASGLPTGPVAPGAGGGLGQQGPIGSGWPASISAAGGGPMGGGSRAGLGQGAGAATRAGDGGGGRAVNGDNFSWLAGPGAGKGTAAAGGARSNAAAASAAPPGPVNLIDL